MFLISLSRNPILDISSTNSSTVDKYDLSVIQNDLMFINKKLAFALTVLMLFWVYLRQEAEVSVSL